MKRWIWPAVAAAAVGLAGCGSATNTGAAAGNSGATASSSTGSTGTTGASGATGATGTSGATGASGATGTSGATGATTTGSSGSGVPECTTTQLAGTLSTAKGGAAAGSTYYRLVLTNTSSKTCFVKGYPGVSFVTTPDGSPIGAPAKRQPNPNAPGEPTVTLAHGASADSVLRIADAGNYPASSCGMTKVPGLRVYPPDQTASLYVKSQQEACRDKSTIVMDVEPLHASS